MTAPGRLLATYPLLPSFKYCERLRCYVDEIDGLEDNIPGPHPPPDKKIDIFHPDDYTDVDARATNVGGIFNSISLARDVAIRILQNVRQP